MSTHNVPYVKQYEDRTLTVEKPNLNGKKGDPSTIIVEVTKKVLSNPIDKRYDSGIGLRGNHKQRPFRNRKGTRLVVTNIGRGRFTKIKTILQHFPDRTVQHRFMFDNKKNKYFQTK